MKMPGIISGWKMKLQKYYPKYKNGLKKEFEYIYNLIVYYYIDIYDDDNNNVFYKFIYMFRNYVVILWQMVFI